MTEIEALPQAVENNLTSEEGYNQDEKISHVENLFIIAYLTKALQDIVIRKLKILQYPLLLIDFPLALAILIVNVERILYVKVLGYVLAHIQFDVMILKSILFERSGSGSSDWKEKLFDCIRKCLRFAWGVVILLFILPVWPLIWIYNQIVQTLLIAVIYYFLLFTHWTFSGAFLLYYLLLATVTFLVSSITVPFIFQVGVYIKAMFSLDQKTWREVHREAKLAFVNFYQRLYGNYNDAMHRIKIRYVEGQYKAEGGVYYMLLKFLHFLKDKLWELKEKKIDVVVEKIQHKTVEFVDTYYQEKNAYDVTLKSIAPKDLRKTAIAFILTIILSLLLVQHGSRGEGIIGPILRSFVDRSVSEYIWINQFEGRGYYEDMVMTYYFLPNFLKYIAIGVDFSLHYFFQAYYIVYPMYVDFLYRYYALYYHALTNWVLYNF